MHIKRFQAPDWPSALQRVREELEMIRELRKP